jgi:Zn-dependent peptidase ImmA (M78 family)
MDATRMGKDLAEAREAWEISAEALAEQCELDPQDVHAAEGGAGDVSTFSALVTALGGTLEELAAGRKFWIAPTIALRAGPGPLDRPVIRATLLRLSAAAAAHRAVSALVPEAQTALSIDPAPLGEKPAAQAEELAKKVREQLENPHEPIASVRNVLNRFGFATFLSPFVAEDVDGISWRDPDGRGYAAANVAAREGAVTAIRMTFAHELCHLLFDGRRGEPLGIFEKRGRVEAYEQRANAFGAYLLAPRSGVSRLLRQRGLPYGKTPNAQDVLALSAHFGMGVEAVANHLVNLEKWVHADKFLNRGLRTELLQGIDNAEYVAPGAATAIPLERRGEVLDRATAALEEGNISAGRWRELVALDPFDDCRAILAERDALGHVEYSSM